MKSERMKELRKLQKEALEAERAAENEILAEEEFETDGMAQTEGEN